MSLAKLNPGARRYRAVVRHAGNPGGGTWHEDFVDVSGDPEGHARALVRNFNATLRPGELPREVVEVRLDEGEGALPHAWEKRNLVTERLPSGSYGDRYRCRWCGAAATMVQLGVISPVGAGVRYRGCPGPRLPEGRTRRVRRRR